MTSAADCIQNPCQEIVDIAAQIEEHDAAIKKLVNQYFEHMRSHQENDRPRREPTRRN